VLSEARTPDLNTWQTGRQTVALLRTKEWKLPNSWSSASERAQQAGTKEVIPALGLQDGQVPLAHPPLLCHLLVLQSHLAHCITLCKSLARAFVV
jgi:hypothetical protein